MNVTFYLRPDGRTREMNITNVRDDDALWFEQNDVTVSMEELNDSTYAIYADIGLYEDDGETPKEIIYVTSSPSESCEEALSNLRIMCQEELNEA